jgi:hypothetical protein
VVGSFHTLQICRSASSDSYRTDNRTTHPQRIRRARNGTYVCRQIAGSDRRSAAPSLVVMCDRRPSASCSVADVVRRESVGDGAVVVDGCGRIGVGLGAGERVFASRRSECACSSRERQFAVLCHCGVGLQHCLTPADGIDGTLRQVPALVELELEARCQVERTPELVSERVSRE